MKEIREIKCGAVLRSVTALAMMCAYTAGSASSANACDTCKKDKKAVVRVQSETRARQEARGGVLWYRSYPTHQHYPYSGRERQACGGAARDGWQKMVRSLARSRHERAREIVFDLSPGEYKWRAESRAAYTQYVSIRGRGGNSADAAGNSQGPVRAGRMSAPGFGPVIGEGILRGPDRLRVSISHSSEPYGSRTSNLWLSPDLDDALFDACSSESFCFRTEDMVTEQGGVLTLAHDSDADFDDAILCIERIR